MRGIVQMDLSNGSPGAHDDKRGPFHSTRETDQSGMDTSLEQEGTAPGDHSAPIQAKASLPISENPHVHTQGLGVVSSSLLVQETEFSQGPAHSLDRAISDTEIESHKASKVPSETSSSKLRPNKSPSNRDQYPRQEKIKFGMHEVEDEIPRESDQAFSLSTKKVSKYAQNSSPTVSKGSRDREDKFSAARVTKEHTSSETEREVVSNNDGSKNLITDPIGVQTLSELENFGLLWSELAYFSGSVTFSRQGAPLTMSLPLRHSSCNSWPSPPPYGMKKRKLMRFGWFERFRKFMSKMLENDAEIILE
uniref:Uncharacterized protein n=1 Tax=Trieres chinensis TaxID=1514140 RepID=A0A7S2EUW6_TRICV|mmetsp:Transcript_40055/g.81818  ORF Transcript_40055/g.81818 Transcript_40055/m.81818 type:complete len:307 (+) Transcript_40055:2-922(+)